MSWHCHHQNRLEGDEIRCPETYLVFSVHIACPLGTNACQSCSGKAASRVLRPFLPAQSGSIRTITFSNLGSPCLKFASTVSAFLPSTQLLLPSTKTCSSGLLRICSARCRHWRPALQCWLRIRKAIWHGRHCHLLLVTSVHLRCFAYAGSVAPEGHDKALVSGYAGLC